MFYAIEQDLQWQKYREPRKKNVTKEEYKAVRSLKHNKEIIIKPADKGSAIVIMDKISYSSEGWKQLENTKFYEQTDTDLTGEVIHRVNLYIHNILQKGQISQSTCSYLTTDIDRRQQFYLLQKIHNNPKNPPGRPIVSGSGGPIKRISQFVDHFIGLLVPCSKSFIRESTHLIKILNELTLQPGMLLCTLDVRSLYTSTPHDKGTQAIKEILVIHRSPSDLPHNSYIIQLLEVVVTNNHFEFNGTFCHQVSGTAMGTKLTPSYANLFITKFEEKYVYTYPLQPILWKRFIDDIFYIWPQGREPLLKFMNLLNTGHPTIKFTKEISLTKITSLDLMIYIREGKVYTRLHTKTSDRHMYLNFSSEHPISLKKSIPYLRFLRLKRIHTEPQYLLEAQIHM